MFDLNLDLSGINLGSGDSVATATAISRAAEAEKAVEVQPGIQSESAAGLINQSIPQGISAGRQTVYFDIETVPDESRRHLFGLDEPIEEKPIKEPQNTPAQLVAGTVAQIKEILEANNPSDDWLAGLEAAETAGKKRETVFWLISSIRKARNSSNDPQAKADKIKKMSVTPEYLKIVAMGIAIGSGDPVGLVVNDHLNGSVSEVELLEWFWDVVKHAGAIVGYNILGFDLPAIMVRSALLGVTPSRTFDTKPWGTDTIDLMLKRWPRGGQMRLKDVAPLYGIEVDAGDMDGGQVYEVFETEPHKLKVYVASDVKLCQRLHRVWSGLFC